MAVADREASPRLVARLTGALYLYIMVSAMFAEAFVRDKLIVSGDALATARNIAGSEGLYRWGVAADISTTVCDVAVAALLYVLLRPVSRTGALTAAFFRLAYAAAMAANASLLIGPLLLDGAARGSAQPAEAAQALIVYSLRLHEAGFDVALVLFGVHLVLIGALITRSNFLPRALGAAILVAGGCYVLNSFAGFVAPGFASHLSLWLLLPGFLAEGALTLWLLIAGVDAERWKKGSESGG